jgi:condensin complex subunit 2
MERFPPKPVTNSRRSISLFSSPKVRKSIGFSNVSPALLLETPHAETGVPLDPSKSVQVCYLFSLFWNDEHLSSKFTYIQNNDEQELRERQKQRAAEMQQQSLASPSTPADRRKSMGPATGMTNAALVEHYSNCIKLSAENVGLLAYYCWTQSIFSQQQQLILYLFWKKINMKNAFNLQLIDCMSEMLRKKDPEMNNFQVRINLVL